MSAALIPITTLDQKILWVNREQIVTVRPTRNRLEWGSADLSDTVTIAMTDGSLIATREDITDLAARINRTTDTKGTTHD